MEESNKRFLLGYVSVDSGQLVLVDPCYLRDWKDGPFDLNLKPDNHYAECCLKSLSVQGGGQVFSDLAVCFSTGWGDGTYPGLCDQGIRKDRQGGNRDGWRRPGSRIGRARGGVTELCGNK